MNNKQLLYSNEKNIQPPGDFLSTKLPNSDKLLSDLLHQFSQCDINPPLMGRDHLCGNNLTASGGQICNLDSFGLANAAGPKRSRKMSITEAYFPTFFKYRAKGMLLLDSSEMKYLLSQEIPALIYSR